MAAIKALQQWCRAQCEGYRDVSVSNMTSCFRDGLAFCAIIHRHRPDLIDYDSLSKANVYENNSLAFRVAEEKLGIPALLDAEDMVALPIPDRLSILTYVSQYYNYFHGRSASKRAQLRLLGGVGGIKRPAEEFKEEPLGKKNQPVTAKAFLPKPSRPTGENQPSPTAVITSPSRNSLKKHGATDQKKVLSESTNKAGTLNNTCTICQGHVHLVQRYFVDGKLYHRNCFKCSECSSTLVSGAYKPGSREGTFICTTHQSAKSWRKAATGDCPTRGAASKMRSDLLTTEKGARQALKPSSVLCTPVSLVPRPTDPAPTCRLWTASAAKTQAARQRFFQDTQTMADPQLNVLLPAVTSRSGQCKGTMQLPGDRKEDKARISQGFTEGNTNNNNKSYQAALGTVQSRGSSLPATKPVETRSQGTNNKEMLWLKAITKKSPRLQSCHSSTEGSDSLVPSDWRSKLKPLTNDSKDRSAGFTEDCLLDMNPLPTSVAEPVPVVSIRTPSVESATPSPEDNCSPRLSPDAPEIGVAGNGETLPLMCTLTPGMESLESKLLPIPQEDILSKLNRIEESLNKLEKEGVEMEKRLRCCEGGGKGDVLDVLMVDWFALIQKKQFHMRRESELVYIARMQDLEDQQLGVELELRRLMEKPEHFKTVAEVRKEQELFSRLVEIVDDRNLIVQVLDDDRLRELEEDEQLNEMMQQLGVGRRKKKKSAIKKLFK
ncbi:MICAL-like protein 2 [Arapaima gigas]